MKDMDAQYEDNEGKKVDLGTLCRREPEWAANRIRAHYAAFKQILWLLGVKPQGTAPDCITAYCLDNLPEWERQ